MGLLQQLTSILLKGPKVCTTFYSHKRLHPRPVIMVFQSSISTSEWEARQPIIEHEMKMGRTNPSGPELDFHGSCSRRSEESCPFPAENCLRPATKQWPRPTAIPWQVKVANAVHLIGTINAPVEIIHMNQGKMRAATVLVKKSPSPFNCLGIRLIFEDDLAETAACYLKLGDLVYVSGQLDADSQYSTNGKKQPVAQVVVNILNFIKQDFPAYSYEKGDVLLNKTNRESSPGPGFNRGPK